MKSFFKSKFNILILSLSISLAVQLGFSVYQNFSIERPVAVIDFSLMRTDDILLWASENQIQIEFEEMFDEDIPLGQVITQSNFVGERLFSGSRILIVVSKGPDPEVLVDLIDFEGLDIGDIQLFIETSQLLNATIAFEKSEDIDSAYFIRRLPAENRIRRGDEIQFFISTGDNETLTTVMVPDFTEYTRQQITTWGSSSNIKINFIDEFNSEIGLDKVISQSQAANQEIYDGSSITIRMSLGQGVVLENLVGKTKTQIDTFISDSSLKINYSYSYSAAQNKDIGISMIPSANTRVSEGSSVNVVLSLGRISMSNFTGKRFSELEAWVTEINRQGGNLKVSSSTTYSDTVTSGLLISQSPTSGDVNPGSEIRVSVSKGAGVVVRNFVGSSVYTQENLRVNRSDTYHSSVAAGSVISQTIPAGTQVDINTSINIVVSLGKVNISNYTGNSLSALQAWVNGENAKGANLSISSSTAFNSAASGNIISQNPSSGSVNPGTSISVSVSKGPGVTVKNFVGGSSLSQDGLRVTTSSVYNESVASGLVISQSINAGAVVDTNTSISLVVSQGPEPRITIPDLAGLVAGQSTSVATSRSIISSYFNDVGATNYSFVEGAYNIGAGQVNNQSPGGGTSIRKNDPIVVYISTN